MVSVGEWDALVASALSELRDSPLYRVRRLVTPVDATHVVWQGRTFVNFASNNYLGLTHHPAVVRAAQSAIHEVGTGSGASALICGYGPAHAQAEQRIARWKGTQAAVLCPSGYQANHAAVQTVAALAARADRPIRFLLDKLSHASLIDAVRATGAEFRVFPHNGIAKLGRLLADAAEDQLQVVITESIFSMDGDAADLAGLAELKARHAFLLLLDEAHATGVYGPCGSGLAREAGFDGLADVTVITLSKSIGSVGGAICGSGNFCEAVVNLGRAYLYSTNVPANAATAAVAAIEVMEAEPERQSRVRSAAKKVRTLLSETRWAIPPGDSPIIPVILGDESATLAAAESLMNEGLFVLPIRPPTVPRGSSRLRITLSSEHTPEEVDRLIRAARGVGGMQ